MRLIAWLAVIRKWTKAVCSRGQPPASRIMLQVICSKIGSRLRSTVSKSVALMLPRARH
jgi:hypothetical protein